MAVWNHLTQFVLGIPICSTAVRSSCVHSTIIHHDHYHPSSTSDSSQHSCPGANSMKLKRIYPTVLSHILEFDLKVWNLVLRSVNSYLEWAAGLLYCIFHQKIRNCTGRPHPTCKIWLQRTMTQILWPSAAVALTVTKCCKFDSFTMRESGRPVQYLFCGGAE